MELSASNVSKHESEEKALKALLEAFGSSLSLEAIASAYCDAGKNADFASEILNNILKSTSTTLTHAPVVEESGGESAESSDNTVFEKLTRTRASRQKLQPASAGTISGILGKNYINCVPMTDESIMTMKPVKLNANEWPISELWGGGTEDTQPDNRIHKDMEDFFFKMLGDGFQLERDVIQKVLGKCGYDMNQSMEKLLDLSAVDSDDKSKYLGTSTDKFRDAFPNSEGSSCQKTSQFIDSSGGISITNGAKLTGREQQRNDLQMEVLASFFQAPEKPKEDVPKQRVRSTRTARRPLALGKLVEEPPTDSTLELKPNLVNTHQHSNRDENHEDGYQLLRKAVLEHRATMKEYYKAAVDAFAKGDYDKANKLMDQGHFFHEKAQQADEESSQKVFEINNSNSQDEISLDLHEHGPREAIRLLKCHISRLAGIPSFKYLKVIVETDEQDSSKGARRRLILKLLEKDSIKWTEGENAGTVLIHVDNINPKSLSFVK